MDAAKGRILLAEDEPRVARPLIEQLERQGHEVRWARAIREVRGQLPTYSPDLLLLDVTLDNDGLELFQAIRFAPDHPRGGVIVLTEQGDTASRDRAHQLGAAAVVTKPIHGDDLIAVVDDLLAFI